MEIRRKIPAGALYRVIEGLFFCTLFALPWNNDLHVATLLFIVMIILLTVTGLIKVDYTQYVKEPLYVALVAYYALVTIGYFRYQGPENGMSMEQKVSLIGVPVVLYVLIDNFSTIWISGIKGFIWGNAAACCCCMGNAIYLYMKYHDTSVFFYHKYSGIIGQNAIYFSFYLFIAIGYIMLDESNFSKLYMKLLGLFLYINLLLLSSKIIIATTSIILLILMIRSIKSATQRLAALALPIGMSLIILLSGNPIKKRFTDIDIYNYASPTQTTDFTDFKFDGLNLRLVLWHMGSEIINEKKVWLVGDGGKRYHEDLNKKIKLYKLYYGNGTPGDTGYQNYNMHNQYIESYVQFGLAGLSVLSFSLLYVLGISIYHKHTILLYSIALFIIAFITESVLETQSGVMLFTVIIAGEWIQLSKKKWKSTIS